MENFKKDWTHKNVEIVDIRKLSNLYLLSIKSKDINKPLFVNSRIFEDRLKSYYLFHPKESLGTCEISREQILSLKWNMYITKGYYIKIHDGIVEKYDKNTCKDKYYISFLEIDGPLGTFESVYKEHK